MKNFTSHLLPITRLFISLFPSSFSLPSAKLIASLSTSHPRHCSIAASLLGKSDEFENREIEEKEKPRRKRKEEEKEEIKRKEEIEKE